MDPINNPEDKVIETTNDLIFVPIKLSTTGTMEPFWGVELNLPVAHLTASGEIINQMSIDDIITAFKTYLTEICKPFPILMERIKYLNISFHADWEQTIIDYYKYTSCMIYTVFRKMNSYKVVCKVTSLIS